MTRKIWCPAVLFVALVTLGAGTASAQAVDARKAIEAAAKAMGTMSVKSIQFVGDGYVAKVGEQYNLTDGWPQVQVTDYTRTIDYDGNYMRVRGTGASPLTSHAKFPFTTLMTWLPPCFSS